VQRGARFIHSVRTQLALWHTAVLALVLVAPVSAAQRSTSPAWRSPFQKLLDDHWQWSLRENPVLATTLGDHRYDRQLGDLSVGAMDRRARESVMFLAQANALDTTRLSPSERVTLAILRRDLAETVEGSRFGQRTILFTTYYGWHTGFADLGVTHPFRDRADYEAYVARLGAYPRYNRGGIETTRADLDALLPHVDLLILNDSEAREMTKETSLIKAGRAIRKMGPGYVAIKKGEHGALLFGENEFFSCGAYPLEDIHDPTGAGDTFAGGMAGYLAGTVTKVNFTDLRKAVIYGSVLASFTVEAFSLERLRKLSMDEIKERYETFKLMSQFEALT